MFQCDKCGESCRNIILYDLYADLDRGDGTCKYLKGNSCGIYDERPLKCRVDDSYYAFFKDKISIKEYYRLNKEMCNIIKKLEE